MEGFNNENQCILALCRQQDFQREYITTAFKQRLHLPYVLGQLLFHRVGGIAYHVLAECGLLSGLNREFRNPLKMVCEASRAKTKSFLQAENELALLFAQADFPHAFLKGALLSRVYPLGLRTSNDFDVLIHQQDTQKITDLLTESGFTQGFLRNDVFTPATRSDILYARMNKGETVPFVKRIGLPHMPWLEVDVNFSLDFKAEQNNDAVQKILERAENTIVTESGALPTLSKVDFLIHLCAHLYKEATTYHWVNVGRDLSLYKFCDILLFIDLYFSESYEDLANELAEAIETLSQQKPCAYTFYYARELFGLKNSALDDLITRIMPADTDFLRQVYHPAEQKTYCFDMDYTDYLFHQNRIACLREV